MNPSWLFLIIPVTYIIGYFSCAFMVGSRCDMNDRQENSDDSDSE